MDLNFSRNEEKLLRKLITCDCGLTDDQLDAWAEVEGLLFPRMTFKGLVEKEVARLQQPDPGSGRLKRYKPTAKAWEVL